MISLANRTAIVTGAGRGIGASVAERLAEAGATVLVTARTASEVEGVATRLRAAGQVARAIVCDVTSADSVDRLAAAARELGDRVDILVNNAGAAMAAPVHKTTLDDWNRVMAVNATGAFLCMKAFLPGMLDARWGRVVNVASMLGLAVDRYVSAYAASKHALIGLTRGAAADVAGRGVTINAVCPGYVRTEMTRATLARIVATTGRTEQQALEAVLKTTKQERLIEPGEVAERILFLCSDGAADVNGAALVMDGRSVQVQA